MPGQIGLQPWPGEENVMSKTKYQYRKRPRDLFIRRLIQSTRDAMHAAAYYRDVERHRQLRNDLMDLFDLLGRIRREKGGATNGK